MVASAAATGAASCVSSVSKLNDAARRTGSLGLKSHDANWVVLGMALLVECESIATRQLGREFHGRGDGVGHRGGQEPREFRRDVGILGARDVVGVYGGDGCAFIVVVGVDVGVGGLQL